jgi:hypothetical protein
VFNAHTHSLSILTIEVYRTSKKQYPLVNPFIQNITSFIVFHIFNPAGIALKAFFMHVDLLRFSFC